MLRDPNSFVFFLCVHLEQTCHVHCFSSGWAMKPVAAIQLGASKAKSWGPPAPQFPLPSQVPGASGKGGIEGSYEEVRSESSQKIMACILYRKA